MTKNSIGVVLVGSDQSRDLHSAADVNDDDHQCQCCCDRSSCDQTKIRCPMKRYKYNTFPRFIKSLECFENYSKIFKKWILKQEVASKRFVY